MTSITFVLLLLLSNGEFVEKGQFETMAECIEARDQMETDGLRALMCVEGSVECEG